MTHEFPTLYGRDRKGAVLEWNVTAVDDLVVTAHGKLGGRKAINKTRSAPTNVGRANARNADEQAIFEAQAAWTKKVKEGYCESVDKARSTKIYLPMLAHPMVSAKTKREIDWSNAQYAQPKLNGLRCLATIQPDGSVSMMSRQGTPWTILGHIEEQLKLIGRPGDIFDGEIYQHGIPLQTLNSWVKRMQPNTLLLDYHLYDMPACQGQEDGVWEDRHAELQRRLARYPDVVCRKALQAVPTRLVRDEAEIKAFFSEVITEGYEGLIIRCGGRRYEFNERTDSLLKWKKFIDAEFKIVDVLPREYNAKMTICDKFVCQTADGKNFEVVPRGTMETRAAYWEDRAIYVGRKLVVRFLEYSNAGIPQGNTVGIAIRLPEDMPMESAPGKMW